MNNENTRGGTDKYLRVSRSIVRDYMHFLLAMSTHLCSIDRKDVVQNPEFNLTLLSFTNSLTGNIYDRIKDLVHCLRSFSNDEVNFYDLEDAYEFGDSIFRDFLKKYDYDLEVFYETQKDAEETRQCYF